MPPGVSTSHQNALTATSATTKHPPFSDLMKKSVFPSFIASRLLPPKSLSHRKRLKAAPSEQSAPIRTDAQVSSISSNAHERFEVCAIDLACYSTIAQWD